MTWAQNWNIDSISFKINIINTWQQLFNLVRTAPVVRRKASEGVKGLYLETTSESFPTANSGGQLVKPNRPPFFKTRTISLPANS